MNQIFSCGISECQIKFNITKDNELRLLPLMPSYLIRPNLSSYLFETEELAREYIENIPFYNNLDFWYASSYNGKFRAYCNNTVTLTKEMLDDFPEPYSIILISEYSSYNPQSSRQSPHQ